MGIFKFVLYFIASLVGIIFLQDMSPNRFVTAFVLACVIGVLGATRD